MKKTVFMALIIMTAVLCTACSPKTAAEAYALMAEEYAGAKGEVILYDSRVKVSDGSRTMEYSTSGEAVTVRGDVPELYQSGEVKIDLNVGNTVNVPVKAYYRDGRLYSDINGSICSVEADRNAAVGNMGMFNTAPVELSQEDFKELSMKENEEDAMVSFSLLIDASAAEKITGLRERWERLAGEGCEITFRDIKGNIQAKEYLPVKESLTVTGTVKSGDRTLNVTEDITLEITVSADSAPKVPGEAASLLGQ